MTTHVGHTVTYAGPCDRDGTHDAEWFSTTDAQPSAKCGTCDPPDPVTHRWVRDVDSHSRRRA